MSAARSERSAGFLVYRLAPRGKAPQFLLLDYGKYWDYPKGHVEEGEDDVSAAKRELEEETGIADVTPHDGFRHEMTYFFRHKRRGPIRKTVVFFLGRTQAGEVRLSDEHVGAEFLPYEQALERVTYDNAKDALRAARAFLENQQSPGSAALRPGA
jgi:8-oxo-dGTP pyrophosphatase MutT (NUDIX family)